MAEGGGSGPASGETGQSVRSADPLSVAVEPAPGTLIGRFVVGDVLGRGGMGVVLAARDPALDRDVAIKLLSTEHSQADDQEGQLRLEREARAMARLSHP